MTILASTDAPRSSVSSVHTSADGIALAGRLLIAPLFLLSGVFKVTATSAIIGMISSTGLPFAPLGLAIAIAVEVVGTLALVLGYHTRAVAAIMAVYTLATALAFHTNLADQDQFIHFFKNISIIGGFLQIVAFGGGRFSLDARRR